MAKNEKSKKKELLSKKCDVCEVAEDEHVKKSLGCSECEGL